jgi:putative FmdB family regulatory protein
MPTYEYRCQRCGHEMEEYQSIVAPPLKKCPACGKSALQRLMGTGGCIIFKGSGFYQTDYRSDAYKKSAEADKPATVTGSGKNGKDGSDGKSTKSNGESAPAKPVKERSGETAKKKTAATAEAKG